MMNTTKKVQDLARVANSAVAWTRELHLENARANLRSRVRYIKSSSLNTTEVLRTYIGNELSCEAGRLSLSVEEWFRENYWILKVHGSLQTARLSDPTPLSILILSEHLDAQFEATKDGEVIREAFLFVESN